MVAVIRKARIYVQEAGRGEYVDGLLYYDYDSCTGKTGGETMSPA